MYLEKDAFEMKKFVGINGRFVGEQTETTEKYLLKKYGESFSNILEFLKGISNTENVLDALYELSEMEQQRFIFFVENFLHSFKQVEELFSKEILPHISEDKKEIIYFKLKEYLSKLVHDCIFEKKIIDYTLWDSSAIRLGVALYFSELKSEGRISEVQDQFPITIEKFSPFDLSSIQKNQMLKMVESNWSPRGKLGEYVIKNFESGLENQEDQTFEVITFDGRKLDTLLGYGRNIHAERVIVAFIQYKQIDSLDGERKKIFASSLNVDPTLRSGSVGTVLLNRSLLDHAQKEVVCGTVWPNLDVAMNYVEQIGFRIVGLEENVGDTNENLFQIECDLTQKRSSLPEIEKIPHFNISVDEELPNFLPEEYPTFAIKFLKDDIAQMVASIKPILKNYDVTHYFEDSGTRVMVLEVKTRVK